VHRRQRVVLNLAVAAVEVLSPSTRLVNLTQPLTATAPYDLTLTPAGVVR